MQKICPLTTEQFITQSLAVNRFWLRIMKEHAIFIRLGLPCDQRELIQVAKFFEAQYDALLKRANAFTEPSAAEIRMFNMQVIALTQQYIAYKTRVLNAITRCEAVFNLYALLMDHVRREAVEFVRELDQLLRGITAPVGFEVVREQTFWTRIMADHAKFIAHLLDPSERGLEKKAQGFSKLFDRLRFQAIDLSDMIAPSYKPIPTLDRFTGEVTEATAKLRDFKKTGRNLIGQCKILSEIPELLADHVLREAEHFLGLLEEHKEMLKSGNRIISIK
ncbi:MAG: DUF2935 domain-containing protein [Clostridia bacterium]|nr:DUF2935 domain-containing protein [Clostridia bacterium]